MKRYNSKQSALSQFIARHQQDAMKAAHEYYKTHNRDKMIITKNGTPVARIIPQNQAISYLTDSLTGILKEESLEQVKEETLRGKYEHRRNPKDST